MEEKNIKLKIIFFIATVFCAGFLASAKGADAAVVASSTFTSQVLDAYSSSANYITLTWTDSVPASTTLAMEVRAGNTATPDGTWTSWTSVVNGGSLSAFSSKRYIQYRANFSTEDLTKTPTFYDATIGYYYGGSVLISSPYSSDGLYNFIVNSISWTESKPGSSDVGFQIRSSADGSTWSSWCGPDNGAAGCASTTFFTDPSGGETVDAMFQDQSSDPYFQYKAILFPDGNNFPTVSMVNMNYTLGSPNTRTSSSTFTSQVLNAGYLADFTTLTWTDSVPASTTLAMEVRAGNTATPDGTWTSWTSVVNGGSLDDFDSNRYIQYRATFSTSDLRYTPTLYDVTIPYSYYSTGTYNLISSPYDTDDPANTIGQLRWWQSTSTIANASTSLKFQIRSASTSALLATADWYGPSTSTDYFSSATSTCSTSALATSTQVTCSSLPARFSTSTDNQFIQYKVILETTNSSQAPTLYDVQLTYVVNAPPEIQSLTASQSDTVVNISYQARDVDTDQGGIDPNYINPTYEYSIDGGSNYYSIATTCLDVANWTHRSASTTWLDYTAQWTPSCSLGTNTNTSQAVIRLTIDDREPTNHTAIATTSNFTLDLRTPAITGVASSANSATATVWWTTDINSNSIVEYNTTTVKMIYLAGSSTESVTSHRVDIASLIPNTTYYYQVKSGASTDNNSGSYYTFTTLPDITPPVISNATSTATDLHSSTITWNTDERSSSQVIYSISSDMSSPSQTIAVTDLRMQHSVILSNLSASTTYYFYASSSDAYSNNAASATSTFTTRYAQEDVTPPNITLTPTTTSITLTTSTIYWETNELANSIVDYGASLSLGSLAGSISESTLNHTVSITNLTASTTYYFQVRSQDSAGNSTTSDNGGAKYTFATQRDTTPPVITNTTPTVISVTSANISWQTDEDSISQINYGLTSSYGSSTQDLNYTKIHSITLTNLTSNTTYHYQAVSVDSSSNQATSSDNTFTTLDSSAPVISAVATTTVTLTSATIAWTTDENSNSLVDYGLTTSTLTNLAGNLSDSTQSHTVNIASLTASTTYYYQVRSQDLGGNTAINNNSGDYFTFTTLPDTLPPIITGLNATATDLHSSTIIWNTDERSSSQVIYSTSSDMSNPSLTTIVTDLRQQHSVILQNLAASTTYYFYASSSDSSANNATSATSTLTTRYAQEDLTAPNITLAPTTTLITLTTSTIYWETDELANSIIDYGVSVSLGSLAGDISESATAHTVILPDLTASTTYYFQVRSQDSAGNAATSAIYTFATQRDTTPPNISGISSSVSSSTATIYWQTDKSSDSKVDYGTSTGYGQTATSSTLTTGHIINLSGLIPSTLYHYRVTSADSSQNSSTSLDQTFTTLNIIDSSPPVISNVATSSVGLTTSTIAWTTNENSNSIVDYGLTTSTLTNMAGNISDSATSHSVALDSLTASTTYYFQVRSQDSSGNAAIDSNSGSYYSFTTLPDTTPPVISDVATTTVSNTSANIFWLTDELSTSKIEYGTTTGVYSSSTSENPTLTREHSSTLTNLQKETTYYFRVVSKDFSQNQAESSEYTLTTTKNPGGETIIQIIYAGGGGLGKDTQSPNISDIRITEVTQSSFKVKWTTNEDANSLIEYGKTNQYGSIEGTLSVFSDTHQVLVNNLLSGTTYHLKIVSIDKSGNAANSDDRAIKTLGAGETPSTTTEETTTPASSEDENLISAVKIASESLIERILAALSQNPFLKNVGEEELIASVSEITSIAVSPPVINTEFVQVEVGSDWARFKWATDKKANSIVALTKNTEYDSTKEDPYVRKEGEPDELVTYHEILINDLEPSTLYHYQVRSKSQLGDWSKSEDKVFTTLSLLPQIEDVSFKEIKESSATLLWQTTLPTKTKVELVDMRTGEKQYREDKSYLLNHDFTVTNLKISTQYSLQIFAEDEKQNTSFSPLLTFSTSLSKEPPQISQLRTTTSLIPGKIERVQTIIVWKTDKPATGRVYFEEGITQNKELTLSTPQDPTLTQDHIIITTLFKPGKIYRFRAESIDSLQNKSYSPDFTLLTPKSQESVLDLIIQNFTSIFGFLGGR